MIRCISTCLLLFLVIVQTFDVQSQTTSAIDTNVIALVSVDTIAVDTIKKTITFISKKINKYLVLESKSIFTRDRVYSEGKRLKLIANDGRKMRGRLLIANDTTIVLYNTMNGRLDSFKLNDILLIRNVTLFTNTIGAYYLIHVPLLIVSGIAVLTLGEDWSGILGTFLILSGAGSYGIGNAIMDGFPKSRVNFKYHIYYAKGFKLKPKMVKYLYTL